VTLLLVGLCAILAGGVLAAVTHHRERLATGTALAGLLAGSAVAAVPAVGVVARGDSLLLRVPWSMPLGSFTVGLDPISAFFILPVLALSSLAGIYGAAYLKAWSRSKNLGVCWFFFNTLVASMVLVFIARDGLLFLIGWEVMALASYFLVVFEDEKEAVRRAGRIYVIATHLGTAGLLVLFLLLGRASGSLDFSALRIPAGPGGAAGVAFLLAVIGFGTKAGFMPLHVWLPEAHPASPSHVSAVMSGVMIKTGIYGLVRTITFLGPIPPWWGWTLLGIGVSSGVLGVLFALAQHDLKRLLAYHSVENIGIIAIGLGIGLLGKSYGLPAMAYLGFAGAILHVLNHALFKGLLFLGAGAVGHAAHSLEIDRMGGLLRRMPWTGVLFLIGSAAICGLPPLNGFVSEFLIYLGALEGIVTLGPGGAAAGAIAVVALALIGGLAAACFAKAFGILFLGEPRSDGAAVAREVSWTMRLPMIVLAAACVAIGLLGPIAAGAVRNAALAAAGLSQSDAVGSTLATTALRWVVLGAAALLLSVALLVLLRRRLLSGRRVATAPTWDCGYVAPTARMQYTASGFAQPLTSLFRFALRTERDHIAPHGLFPRESTLATHTPDPVYRRVYEPFFAGVGRLLSRQRWLQSGQMQLYVLYIALTLLLLLVWKLA
jgi:formate hydrogenlyase subunit 3/multisubunit Na+/H+ antiporter MnhD subunit